MTEWVPPVVDIAIALEADAPDGAPPLLGLDAADIERVVALTLARAGIATPVEVSIVITSDGELHQLNRTYRGRDETTDVLSFPLLDAPLAEAPAGQLWGAGEPVAFVAPPDGPVHLGDIVIARGVTERQAAQAGHSAAWELAYLVAHGVLHLVGYDDHTDAGYTAMVAHQEFVLRQAGISQE